jgi:hypothetical protein
MMNPRPPYEFRHCERSEAIQLLSLRGKMDCFAALAMTRRERALDSRASENSLPGCDITTPRANHQNPVHPFAQKYSA